MQDRVLYSGSTTLPNFRGHFHRPRIDKLLDAMLERYLIVVEAGAGSGKTHAVSAYLHRAKARVLWLQLSMLDNNLSRFWEEFLYVVAFHSKSTAMQLGLLGFPETLLRFNKFLHIIAKEIYSNEQVVFVFDDFHLIQEESILRFIQNLILARLENFCIIINTREKPSFNLTGMISNGLVGGVTAQDLYFTLDETAEYIKSQGVTLTAREIKRVQDFTEGWPLALYLVGLSTKKGGMVSINPIAGAIPLIFDMIEKELFYKYTPQMQNFLIRASLLNAFPEGLIKTLAGEHASDVSEFIRKNMFIYDNPYTGHYNFHHLFLEFLREKQKQLTRRETDETYLSAAEWCADNDLKIEALAYYDKCNCHDEILNIMFNFGVAIFTKTIADFYISLIDRLPRELIKRNPLLHVHRAGLLCNNAEVHQAINELLEVQSELELQPQTEAIRAVLGEVCCMLGIIYLGIANYTFINEFDKARAYLPNGSAMLNSKALALNTRYAIMLNNPAPGELKKMEDALFYAMPLASGIMHGYGQGMEYLASAEAAYFTADIKKAERNAHEAIYRAREKRVGDVACSGYFLLMRIEAANGNYEGVVTNLERMKAYADELDDKWNFNGMPDVADGWFNLMFGNTENVAGWLSDNTFGDDVLAPFSMGVEKPVKAKYLLKRGMYYELLAWLTRSEKPIRQNHIWLSLLDILIYKALAYHNIGDGEGALTALKEAYWIARDNGLIMQFTEHGNDIRAVIYYAEHTAPNDIPGAWLSEIYTKAATYEKHLRSMRLRHRKASGQAMDTSIKITKREKEVLDYVCQGLTNTEIASACFITQSAVKKTLNNLYIKLGATNRADAVRVAMQMGLDGSNA